jgi:hypothetical protein
MLCCCVVDGGQVTHSSSSYHSAHPFPTHSLTLFLSPYISLSYLGLGHSCSGHLHQQPVWHPHYIVGVLEIHLLSCNGLRTVVASRFCSTFGCAGASTCVSLCGRGWRLREAGLGWASTSRLCCRRRSSHHWRHHTALIHAQGGGLVVHLLLIPKDSLITLPVGRSARVTQSD